MNAINTAQRTVLYLLSCLTEKLENDTRLTERTTQTCCSCVQSIQYILEPIPHRKLNPDFQPENNYVEYIKHLSKSVRRNKNLSEANYQNLQLLIQTLQTELWNYK